MIWASAVRKFVSRTILKRPIMGVAIVFIAGMAFWSGFNWSLEVTNTESFCISCHEMEAFVYAEYKASSHYGILGVSVALVLAALIAVTLVQRRRAMTGKIRGMHQARSK